MENKERIIDLNERLGEVISSNCNKIGCANCGLKWIENGEETCQANYLQNEILDLEFKKYKKSN